MSMLDKDKILYLENFSRDIRIDIINAGYGAGKNGSHLGGCLSMAEMLAVLYSDFVRIDNDDIEKRDRVILSKGHGALALYSTLHQLGILSDYELATFENNGSEYTAHAHRDFNKGLEFTGGSLGLGLSFAAGVAYSCKLKGLNNRIYCFVGDGELNEGIIWEALMFISHYNLSNLSIVVDNNHLQIGGNTDDVMKMSPLAEKFESFGFFVQSVDGHDVGSLYEAYKNRSDQKPNVVIANTIKGKGVSFIENKYKWHFGVLTESKYASAIQELSNPNC